MTIEGIISMLIIPYPYNTIVNLFIPFFVAYIVFKNSIFRTILSMSGSLFLSNLFVVLLLNPYIRILHINADVLATVPLYRFFYLLMIYTFLALSIIFIKRINLYINIFDALSKRNKIIIVLNLLFGILTIAMQSIILTYYVDILPIFITLLSFLSLFVYFAISVYSLISVMKLTSTIKKLESAEEYNNTLQILHDNVRGFKHDFDNILTTLGGYIHTEDMEGLKKYYNQLVDDSSSTNNLYILNPSIVNNDGIYNLITKKYHEATSKNIKMTITFLLDLSTLNMKIYEFARILGILLDNAIEASSESDEKIVNLIFRYEPNNNRQLITIENSYIEKNIDTEKIFEKGVSGKENHTGIGLWEVRKIISKYDTVNLLTTTNSNLFIQQIEIYYDENNLENQLS
ncbi:MAG: GHKL domain-containing protein [Clostridia bacterium]|nr:GHKL domain-containing protein [Clostridia bacterium]